MTEETEVIPQQAAIPFPMEEREGRKSRIIPLSEALAGAVGLPIQEAEAVAIRWSRWPHGEPYAAGGGGGSYNSGSDQTNTAGTNDGHGRVVITALTPFPSNSTPPQL